ncbi:hypothetical protein [Lysinibacillus xylanilyticus]|uniref:hypothetical protein n=1 Tax=Lysinibacillus xylanilyticus TaxID=582475 RepID=UPI00381C18E6
MSNNHGFNKMCKDCEGREDCKSLSRFKVSSCAQVPSVQDGPEPPVFTPVYGSLYNTNGVVAVSGANVDFDTVGPSSGVTLDTVNDSITVNSSGVYTISFSTEINANDLQETFNSVFFRLSINGTPDPTKETSFQTALSIVNEVNTISRTDQLKLNQGDVIRVFIFLENGNPAYFNAALVVTKVA